jgi:hypothetical protein
VVLGITTKQRITEFIDRIAIKPNDHKAVEKRIELVLFFCLNMIRREAFEKGSFAQLNDTGNSEHLNRSDQSRRYYNSRTLLLTGVKLILIGGRAKSRSGLFERGGGEFGSRTGHGWIKECTVQYHVKVTHDPS